MYRIYFFNQFHLNVPVFCLCCSTTRALTAGTLAPLAAKGGTWCSLKPRTRCKKTTISSLHAASSTSARSSGWRRMSAFRVRQRRVSTCVLSPRPDVSYKPLQTIIKQMASRECLWVRVCLFVYNHPHDCSFFPGQSLITPSVETRFWRKVRSAMWVTMTLTCAASAPHILSVSSVTSNLAKSAGITTAQWHVFELFVAVLFSFCLSVERVSVSLSLSISPSQGLCCGRNCEFEPAGQTCDEETDCQRESVCSGFSPLCPEPSAKENLTVCSQGTRVCLNGVRQPYKSSQSVSQLAWAVHEQCCKVDPEKKTKHRHRGFLSSTSSKGLVYLEDIYTNWSALFYVTIPKVFDTEGASISSAPHFLWAATAVSAALKRC